MQVNDVELTMQEFQGSCNCTALSLASRKKKKKEKERRSAIFEPIALLLSLLFIICFLPKISSISSSANQSTTNISNSHSAPARTKLDNNEKFRLECQPGEQRQFAYESSTKVWGTSNQQVRLRATLRLSCMEAATNSTLKYFAQIVRLEPNFLVGGSGEVNAPSSGDIPKRQKLLRNKHWAEQLDELQYLQRLRSAGLGADDARAEPLLEEVGEAAIRMKRSVSGWFTKAWGSVKEFFVNIFQSSDKTLLNREQAFRESGLDIAGQCRAPKGSSKGRNPLPFDESVFEDLGPEYYVGASSVAAGGLHSPQHAYEFSGGADDGLAAAQPAPAHEEDEQLSFFDDPKQYSSSAASASASSRKMRRSVGGGASRKSKAANDGEDYGRLLKIPFVFVQARSGKIVEIRFSGEETDSSVKNFKRHLCDLFATNLESALTASGNANVNASANKTTTVQQQQQVANEVSPIGKHQTKYTLDSSANSLETMKQTAIKATANEFKPSKSSNGELEKENLVRVLALVGGVSTKGSGSGTIIDDEDIAGLVPNSTTSSTSTSSTFANGHNDEPNNGRDPSSSQDDASEQTVSVLRSINTTSQLQVNSKSPISSLASSEIDRIQVQVKQVQQISSGRLLATAGQLSMSLLVGQQQQQPFPSARSLKRRAKRDSSESHGGNAPRSPGMREEGQQTEQQQQQVSDIAELLQVSTSFSLHLVPVPRKVDGSIDEEEGGIAEGGRKETSGGADSSAPMKRVAKKKAKRSTTADGELLASATPGGATTSVASQLSGRQKGTAASLAGSGTKSKIRKTRRDLLFRPAPGDAQELQRILMEWRKQEARLQLSSSPLVAEQSNAWENEQLRLDTMRDQVRQRLNEEFLRNRIRRSLSGASLLSAQQAAAPPQARPAKEALESGGDQQSAGGDFGLGLTQLVLANGITSKRKGSIYSTLEEVIELESGLADEFAEHSVSRLMRETIRMDKLRQHCKSSIPLLDYLAQNSAKGRHVERRMPFGLSPTSDELGEGVGSKVGKTDDRRHELRFGQCRQVLRLLLKMGERKAADLVLELVDECNERLQSVARNEELGYGPMGKYYRHLRHQFVELLANFERPNDALIDKLIARLYYPKFNASNEPHTSSGGGARRTTANNQRNQQALPEFVYVNKEKHSTSSTKYNKTILKEEDDFNNRDAAAQLVMTLTQLAAKSSVSKRKRVEVGEKLLVSLRGTSCSMFDSPDLDIIESMANFLDQFDEIVPRILQLARHCKQSDQYLVASVHALSGQLAHSKAAQRFLADQLRSANSSCLLKSEIVSTLINAQIIDDLKRYSLPSTTTTSQPDSDLVSNSTTTSSGGHWPSYGLNQVDEALLEIIGSHEEQAKSSEFGRSQIKMNRRCLGSLAKEYFLNKRPNGRQLLLADTDDGGQRKRVRRAVVNEQNFWDEAQCRRWTVTGGTGATSIMQASGLDLASGTNATLNGTNQYDLLDELDDSSILNAFVSQQQQQQQQQQRAKWSGRGGRRGPKTLNLVGERESESALPNSTSDSTNSSTPIGQHLDAIPLRRRHKCMAQKNFGPRNAQALVSAEIVNDLVGPKDENKFLARFRLSTNFLGNKIDVGRMYLWHQRRTTRAHANILGKSIWDTSHNCNDKAPAQVLYMPLFDFNLWLVKVSVGLRLNAEMGFFSDCEKNLEAGRAGEDGAASDELQLYPTIALRAAGEASAKLVVARAGMSLASQYSYQGNIRVSRQPDSCMSISSAHQPMNITFSSWFQLWDNDCHYWGSRSRAEPQAVRWRLLGRKASVWIENECLSGSVTKKQADGNGTVALEGTNSSVSVSTINP